MLLTLEVGEEAQTGLSPQTFRHDSSSCLGFIYPFATAAVELLFCPLMSEFAPGRSVDECWGCVLRVLSKVDSVGLLYRAAWAEEVPLLDGGGNCGEHMEAQTWNDGVTEVSLGTPDEEGLVGQVGWELPQRWGDPLRAPGAWGRHVFGVGCRGIQIVPPLLRRGEACELYFKLAWCRCQKKSEETWFAVDPFVDRSNVWWPGQANFRVPRGTF